MIVIDAKELKAAAGIADNKKRHASLYCVRVANDGGRTTVTATDSYKLIEFSREDRESDAGEVLIDGAAVKSAMPAKAWRVMIDDAGEETVCQFVAKDGSKLGTVGYRRIERPYPRTDRLFKNYGSGCPDTVFDAALMEDVCRCVRTAYGKGCRVDLHVGGVEPIEFAAACGESSFRALLMPIRR